MKERGNALFLILIAVALFAALSYAVTQSGRGGAGVDKEQAVIHAARITAYATAAEAAVQRMQLIGGTTASTIEFCSISTGCFTHYPIGAAEMCETGENCLFASEGGGLHEEWIPGYEGTAGYGFYESGLPIGMEGVGETATGELVITAGVSEAVCQEINEGLGLGSTIPQDADDFVAGNQTIDDAFDGEPVQCFQDGTSNYYYFHTLIAQ